MDKIEVWPQHLKPTHHLSLSDGDVTLGLTLVDERGAADPLGLMGNPMDRTPLKFSEGQQKYSDMVYPWSTIAQESWINGRGNETFEDDTTRYFDSKRAWTINGQLQLAGLDTYTTGTRSQDKKDIGSVDWITMVEDETQIAVKFTASASYSVVNIYTLIRRVGTPGTAITLTLCSDDAGNPGTVLKTTTIDTDDITDTLAEYYKAVITAQAITSGTAYWIKVTTSGGDPEDHWKIGVEDAEGTTKISADGASWEAAGFDMYYRTTDADGTYTYKLFNYRYQTWRIENKGAGVQPSLWVNGDYGVADANTGALTTLIDATKSGVDQPWVADEFIGCIVWIIGGTGSAEEKPYRTITDNTTTVLTVDETWIIEHDTTTEYVIIGGPAKWRLITASIHDLAATPVTDIKIFNNCMYFCQGDAQNIRRVQWYQTGGALAHRDDADGTNKAIKLDYMLDNTEGQVVWKANNSDATGLKSAAMAAAPTTWANMTFGAVVPVNQDTGKIQLVKAYSDAGVRQLWIFTEGFIYKINDGKLDPIPLDELQGLMYYRNAVCAITHNVFMIFPWGKGGIQRYYDLNLDDVGSNRGEGLPENRQGYVSALEAHPGKYLEAIDAGADGYSSLLFNNATDNWHEVYRAPAIGERIYAVQSQVIPDGPNRIWIAMGSDMLWIPMPTATVKPESDPNFPYVYEAMVESGYMHSGMPDVWKFFHSVKIWSDNLVEDTDGKGGIDIEVQVKSDTDTAWTNMPAKFYEMPSQEIKIKDVLGINAKRFKYRAILRTNNKLISPKAKSIVIENAMRITVKYAFQFRIRVKDNDHNSEGAPDELNGKEKMDILKRWMDDIVPLQMRSLDLWSDDKTVFLQPIPYQKNKKTMDSWILQGIAVEI